MNRFKKERRRRHAAAYKRLTPVEIAELDCGETEEAARQQRAHDLQGVIFPEEHDAQYDDAVDAKRRAQGINSMSADYARTDARRRALGFAPYMGGPSDLPQ